MNAPTPREVLIEAFLDWHDDAAVMCGMNRDSAQERLVALTRREPIDVERLARAFYNVTQQRFATTLLAPALPNWRDPSIAQAVWDKSVQDGADILAEYDRLEAADKP